MATTHRLLVLGLACLALGALGGCTGDSPSDGLDVMDTSTSDDTKSEDTSTSPDMLTPNPVCRTNEAFLGQLAADPSRPWLPHGGVAAFEPWPTSDDSGLGAVLGVVPAADAQPATVDLTVDGATVVATWPNSQSEPSAQNAAFKLSDGQAAIHVFLADVAQQPAFPVVVGQRVSLRVTTVERFFGLAEITGATDWQLLDAGNTVYVDERTGAPITADDANRVVRVSGQLGAATPCGADFQCFDLEHGTAGASVLLRTNLTDATSGRCATFLGPVGVFNGTVQLDVRNPEWLSLECTPQCAGRTCGNDGCGSTCGQCAAGETCSPGGTCAGCTPQCAGRSCGDDGCGSTCGQCTADETCNASGVCEPLPTGPAVDCPYPVLAATAAAEEVGPDAEPSIALDFGTGGGLLTAGSRTCTPVDSTDGPRGIGWSTCHQKYDCGGCEAFVFANETSDEPQVPYYFLHNPETPMPACADMAGFYRIYERPTGPWYELDCATLGGSTAPSGACVVECYADADCPAMTPPLWCGLGYQHYCQVDECVTDLDCGPEGWLCEGGACSIPCTTDSNDAPSPECPSGWRCSASPVDGVTRCLRRTNLGAEKACSECLQNCLDLMLPSCCQGTGCLCDAECE